MTRRPSTRGRTIAGAVVAFVTGLLFYLNTVQDDTTTYQRPDPPSGSSSSPSAGSTDDDSGLPLVQLSQLPPEAAEAVQRIDDGGPYPFEEDDGVFQNREELLPDRPEGHYREYTVGGREGDRGPLRIVAGADGELYWTADHYRSFSRIVR